MEQVSAEKFIEKLGIDVFPITIVKFLLNKRKILSYFKKATEDNFQIRVKYTMDHSDCEICKEKASEGVLCRQHTSIQRVLTADNVGFDLDTNTYFYKNEIYRMVGSKLVIVYCPHPKLISGEITDSKVRKINPITIEDPNLTALPMYDIIKQFISSDLMDQYLRCWFNNEFSIVTIPNDRNGQNWCLVPNR
jgi:hypothetical protein